MRFTALPSILLLASAALAAPPADKKGREAPAAEKPADKEEEAGTAKPPVVEVSKVTAHSVNVGGRTLAYHATAGTLTIRDTNGKATGSMFYVAYTLDKPGDIHHRPVTFFYNGGPGSASLWLHMGSFAPMRVRTANPEYIKPAPYGFGPNPDTLLPTTDMVFLDAMGTGYSRALGDTKESAFWGVDQDADAFAKGIIRYITKTGRWNSPKFLFGESYGTTRSGALSWQLEDRGVALNGVVLLSSVMNYGRRQPGFDQLYIGYLPSYAATAWYHNRVPDRPADVATFVQQARDYAVGPYASALAKGATIPPAERDAVAAKLAYFTGLPVDYIRQANLRIDLNRFRKGLLRDQRLTLGRYDARYTGVDPDAAGDEPEYDASDTAISGAFVATLTDYLTRDLGYQTDMPYRQSAREVEGYKWDFTHHAPGASERYAQAMPDTAIDLSAAMRTNPYLKVLSANGYYDMATPFFSTEYDLNHMLLDPSLQRNLEFRYYPSGHMVYLNPDALHALHRDVADFMERAVAQAESAMPPARAAIGNAASPGTGGPN
jgi:carboxypeptidase C (cathepsin A)